MPEDIVNTNKQALAQRHYLETGNAEKTFVMNAIVRLFGEDALPEFHAVPVPQRLAWLMARLVISKKMVQKK